MAVSQPHEVAAVVPAKALIRVEGCKLQLWHCSDALAALLLSLRGSRGSLSAVGRLLVGFQLSQRTGTLLCGLVNGVHPRQPAAHLDLGEEGLLLLCRRRRRRDILDGAQRLMGGTSGGLRRWLRCLRKGDAARVQQCLAYVMASTLNMT